MSIKPVLSLQTKEQLEQLIAEENTLILYFSSHNCNVCHAMFPKVMNLAETLSVKVVQIKVDEARELAGQFLVFTVPTLLILHEGKEVQRESRFIDLQAVERTLGLLRSVDIEP